MRKKLSIFILLIFLISLMGLQAVTVIPVGDVNKSGTRDIVDALLIAQYTVGNTSQTIFYMNVADVNFDGAVNVIDALQVAQASAGLITTLALEEHYKSLQSQLTENLNKWYVEHFADYTVELKRSCFCPDMNTLYRIDVEGGSKIGVTNTLDNIQVDAGLWKQYPTVYELFTIIQEAIYNKYIFNRLTFHPLFFHPEIVSLDMDKSITDDEISYTLTNFRTKPAIPPIPWTTLTPEELNVGMSTSRIVQVLLRGNLLTMEFEYDGGCYEHKYYLYASKTITPGEPPQVTIYIQHDGTKPDYCLAILERSVTVDLTPIKEAVGGACNLIIPKDGYHVSVGTLTVLYP